MRLEELKFDLWIRGFFSGIAVMLIIWIYLNIINAVL